MIKCIFRISESRVYSNVLICVRLLYLCNVHCLLKSKSKRCLLIFVLVVLAFFVNVEANCFKLKLHTEVCWILENDLFRVLLGRHTIHESGNKAYRVCPKHTYDFYLN